MTNKTIKVTDSIRAIKGLVRSGWRPSHTFTAGWTVGQVFTRNGATLTMLKTY